MRFLWRNAIFILFPAVVTAIIFLAMINVGTAVKFGQWGEKSIAESAAIVINTKIERLEHMILSADTLFFGTIDPEQVERSCDKWHKAAYLSKLVSAAFVIDDFGDIVSTYYRQPYEQQLPIIKMFRKEIAPQIDKYDSMNQYKHLHLYINGEYYLVTHLTTEFEGQDYISCLLYDTDALEDELLPALLENVGEDRLANVVDDHNQPVFGQTISGAEEFVVSKRFPSTLYKWRLQLAPTAAALFSAKEKERARLFSEALLIPLALAVIVLGLVVLYLSMVRERRLNRLKSEFVANVTHELKTPLSLIRMFGELLSLGKVEDPAKANHYYEIILRETERLTALIDNVLNLARLERGKPGYEFAETDVAEAVERAVDITRPRLEKQNLTLQLNMSGNRMPIRVDDRAITLAVVNLIDNAVKYATDTKYIGVDLIQTSKSVTIDVYDQGPGIPKNQLKRIFDRFYRVSTAETKRQRGSGIGLSLVRDIAEGHGGSIKAASTPYVETRFSIRLPIEHFGR
jgi:two-component system phosphate regulon sensor histidine kinase PhoR